MRESYKTQVLDFSFKLDRRKTVSSKPELEAELEAVLVRHAYHRDQVLLDLESR